MEKKGCGCPAPTAPAGCSGCAAEGVFAYWCGSCQRSVPEKRCPHCGLKAVKKRDSGTR